MNGAKITVGDKSESFSIEPTYYTGGSTVVGVRR